MKFPRYAPGARRARFLVASAATLVALFSGGLAAAIVTNAQAAATTVPLGTAGSFEVLAGTTVTNTGQTKLFGGNAGVSPGSSVTGFPPGKVNAPGSIHKADGFAAGAQRDLTTGYNVAAGEGPTLPIVTDLGGQELTPGVYNSGSAISVGVGKTGTGLTLTLNGGGNPDAVFVFQAGSKLTTASASQINLINGAQSCNVFWQIGSSATLGTGSSFRGTILALTSVSVDTNVTVIGRALARNGAVTLDDDTFTQATCATGTSTTTTTPGTTSTTTPTTTTTTIVLTSPTTTTLPPGNAKPPISPPSFTG